MQDIFMFRIIVKPFLNNTKFVEITLLYLFNLDTTDKLAYKETSYYIGCPFQYYKNTVFVSKEITRDSFTTFVLLFPRADLLPEKFR